MISQKGKGVPDRESEHLLEDGSICGREGVHVGWGEYLWERGGLQCISRQYSNILTHNYIFILF